LCPFAALGKRASPPGEGVRKENNRVSGETITVKFDIQVSPLLGLSFTSQGCEWKRHHLLAKP
jgi:hypothetical protein